MPGSKLKPIYLHDPNIETIQPALSFINVVSDFRSRGQNLHKPLT